MPEDSKASTPADRSTPATSLSGPVSSGARREIAVVYFDGACQPAHGGGVATFGFTLSGPGVVLEESGLAVPPWAPHATNNVAEYCAAIQALEALRGRGYRGEVELRGDSQLVIRQMKGEYAVRADHLKAYHEHLKQLSREFANVRFLWVPREENRRADDLSKEALAKYWNEAQESRPLSAGAQAGKIDSVDE